MGSTEKSVATEGLMKTYDKGDVLPDDYREALIGLMTFQADSEYAGGQRVAENMQYAPRPEEAYRISKKVMEEFGHAYYVWNLLAELGLDVDARLRELVSNPDNPDPAKVRVINGFRKQNWAPMFDHWHDVALFSTVVTPAAVAFLGQYRDCSYRPWAKVNVRIHKEKMGIWRSASGHRNAASSSAARRQAPICNPGYPVHENGPRLLRPAVERRR
jgi:ring-1,2-phenylacetyl-CoA epoxidase subunit PaaA